LEIEKLFILTVKNKFIGFFNIFLILFFLLTFDVIAGDYGDVYGAHPAANGMGNAVTATINNSASVYYNIAGLGRLSEGE